MNQYFFKNILMAIKIDAFNKGVTPITSDKEPLQLLTINKQKGDVVKQHTHPKKKRQTDSLQECLVVIKGRLKIQLYNLEGQLFETVEVREGEAFITLNGGHEIEFLEDSQVFEIKNGPH